MQKLKKLLINDKKCPISSVFSQIMRIFASGKTILSHKTVKLLH